MFNAELFRAPAFPHDSLSSPPSANSTREAGLLPPLSNAWDMQTTCNYLGYKWAVISWLLRTFFWSVIYFHLYCIPQTKRKE